MSGVIENVGERLSALATMDRRALIVEWKSVFGQTAPRGAQVVLLRGALAWKHQIAFEANSEVEQLVRRLRRQSAQAPIAALAPGTRLLREWQGHTHHVTVVEGGFEYAGITYRSLTSITRVITGTAWSGPLFFGLRK